MKRFLFIMLSLCFASVAAAQPLSSGAFAPGESLTYTIAFRSKVLVGANLGEVTTQVSSESVDGTPAWRISARAVTLKMARVLFKLDDRLTTWLSTADGQPIQFAQDISEGNYRTASRYYYDWESGSALARFRKYEGEWKDTPIELTPSVKDFVAHFYSLRNSNIVNTMRSGESRKIGVILNDTVRYINYQYLGPEEKDITGIGKVRTIKLACQLALPEGEKLEDGNTFYVWLSNDRNYIPLYLETPTRFGVAKARLSGYSGLKYPWESVLLGSKLKPDKE